MIVVQKQYYYDGMEILVHCVAAGILFFIRPVLPFAGNCRFLCYFFSTVILDIISEITNLASLRSVSFLWVIFYRGLIQSARGAVVRISNRQDGFGIADIFPAKL